MRFPIRGSETELKKRIEELDSRGFRAIGEPKLVKSASLVKRPQYFVMMEAKDIKNKRS